MNRNRLFILSLMSLAVGMLLVTSCGGGGSGGGSTAPASIMLASVDSAGTEGNSGSRTAAISSDGRYVAFVSDATNLVANDGNIKADVFVHDTGTGITSRVSVSTAGTEGDNNSYTPSISFDGRYVAFESWASNLVANDINGFSDVFVHDTSTGITSRVLVSTAGTEGNANITNSAISSDGRYVVFESLANNLVANDGNNKSDVFVRNTVSNITSRVSVSSAGTEGDWHSSRPAISSDGRYVAFQSDAENLVVNDTNLRSDIFIRDTVGIITSRVSVSSTGTQGNSASVNPSISSDGRYVAFSSLAGNLVANDTVSAEDVFAHNTSTGITSLMSVSTAGTPGNNDSYNPSISSDGRYVVFYSWAKNLVAGDTNNAVDVFVRDTVDNITSRVSVSATGTEGNGGSQNPVISSDGRYVAFDSVATNLIDGTILSGVSHVFRAPRP